MDKFQKSHASRGTLKALTILFLTGTVAGCSSDLNRFSYYDAVNDGSLSTASVKTPQADGLAPVGVGTQSYPGDYRAPVIRSNQYQTVAQASTAQPYPGNVNQSYPVAANRTYPTTNQTYPSVASQPYPGTSRQSQPIYTASVPASQVYKTQPLSAPAPVVTSPVTKTTMAAPAPTKKSTLAEKVRKALNRKPKQSLRNVVVTPTEPMVRSSQPVVPKQDPITTASVRSNATTPLTQIVPMAPDPMTTGSLPSNTTPKGGWTTSGGTRVNMSEGETIYNLSRRYGVPAAEILKANNIKDSRSIRVGQSLTIPVYVYSHKAPVSAPDSDVLTKAAYSHKGSKTIFPRGSNAPVPTMPRQVGVVPHSGVQQSVVHAAAAPSKFSNSHIVASGDTLNRIAYKHGVTVSALKQANGLQGSNIRIGQKLTIPGKDFKALPPSAGTTASVTSARPNVAPAPSSKSSSLTQQAKLDSNIAAPAKTGISKLRWPAKGQIVSSFGGRTDEGKRNDGIDILMPEGSAVKASENGVVIYADSGLKGYGNTVLVRHDGDLVTVYAHASKLHVKRGDKVQRGQVIASSGMTGSAKRPQLHFEVRQKATPKNPISFLE